RSILGRMPNIMQCRCEHYTQACTGLTSPVGIVDSGIQVRSYNYLTAAKQSSNQRDKRGKVMILGFLSACSKLPHHSTDSVSVATRFESRVVATQLPNNPRKRPFLRASARISAVLAAWKD